MTRKLDPWLIAYAGVMAGLYIKVLPLWALFFDGLGSPVSHPLFPRFFEDPRVALVAYLAPLVTLPVLFFHRGRHFAATVLLVCSAVLLFHIEAYNDATFTTCLWVSLWLLWAATPRDPKQAIFLGKALIGLIFLGGAVGKLTVEYWDGSVLHDLYFLQKRHFPFPQLRDGLTAETVRSLATGFSRITIPAELALGTVVFWPLRPAAIAVATMIVGMVFLSGFQLFSVVGPLLFLVFALVRTERGTELPVRG